MANVDFTEQINDFRSAKYGKDVRDSLIEIAEATEDAINNQLITVDDTLTESGQGADAKKTGDEISELKSHLAQGGSFNAEVKAALDQFTASVLQLAEKVAYIDENGQDYYDDIDDSADALHSAMYPPVNLSSISAVYTQSGTVYTTDTLYSLKTDLVVTAHYSDSTTAVVTNYTLSGTLIAGTSTITVTYGGKTTTFNVTVSAGDWGSDYTWLYKASNGELLSARTDLVTPTNTGATETISNSNLNITVPNVDESKSMRYDLKQTTNTNAVLKAKIKINSIASVNKVIGGYGFRLQLSNGTNGIMFYQVYTGQVLSLITYSGNTLTNVVNLDFDTWYILSVEINNGTYTIKLNNEVVYTSTTAATYYCTANRIQIQNSGATGVGNTDIDIAWITYKNND